MTSSGDDEAAQRADAVTVKAKKPFVVIDGTYTSEPRVRHRDGGGEDPRLLEHYVTVDETLKQAPYRWGQPDVTPGR